MAKKHTKQSGFTIVELLVALSIGTVIVLMTSLVFVQGVRHTHAVNAETRVVKASTTLVETMTYHIRRAQSVTIVHSNRLELQVDDGQLVVVELVGSELHIQGNSIFENNIEVSNLFFDSIDNTVLIEYELDTQLLGQPLAKQMVVTRRN